MAKTKSLKGKSFHLNTHTHGDIIIHKMTKRICQYHLYPVLITVPIILKKSCLKKRKRNPVLITTDVYILKLNDIYICTLNHLHFLRFLLLLYSKAIDLLKNQDTDIVKAPILLLIN